MSYSRITKIIQAYKDKEYESGKKLINDYLYRDVNSAIDDFCIIVATVYKQESKDINILKALSDFKEAIGEKEAYVIALNNNPYGMQCIVLSHHMLAALPS